MLATTEIARGALAGPELALAEMLACPLVTLDRRLSRATGPQCQFATPPPSR